MNPLSTNDSVKDKFAAIAAANATMQKMIFKDDLGLPVGAAIFVLGVVETGEILTAIDAVEKTWNEGPAVDEASLPTIEQVRAAIHAPAPEGGSHA